MNRFAVLFALCLAFITLSAQVPPEGPAHAIGVVEGRAARELGKDVAPSEDHWRPISSAVQIEPGLWITRLPLPEEVDALRIKPVCCDSVDAVGIAVSTDQRRLALVRTNLPKSVHVLPIATTIPAQGDQVGVGIGLEGTGVLTAAIPAGVVSAWPGLGMCMEFDVTLTELTASRPVCNERDELCGFIVGSAGAHRSLVMLVTPADVAALRAAGETAIDRTWRPGPTASEQRERAAITAEEAGRISEAVALRKDVLSADPDNFRAIWRLAVGLDQAGHGADAEPIAMKVTEIAPRFSEGWNSLGIIRYRLGKYEDAVAAFATSWQIEPAYFASRDMQAVALSKMGKTDEAVAHLVACVEKDPKAATHLSNLVVILDKAGRAEEAMQHCRRFVAANPDIANGWSILAGRLDNDDAAVNAAIEARRQVKRLAPDDTRSRLLLAALLAQTGDLAAARAEAQEVLELQPNSKDARTVIELLDQVERKRGK